MIGRTLSHYEILAEISRGGMGIVYRARDVKLERDVAIKVLPPELVSDEDRKRRFVQEARAASKLGHPNIAVIHEIDEAEGVTFIAMELIEGEQLSDRLERGAVPLDEALRITEEIAEGVGHAHDKGIVHRDLKPPNVMLTRDGHVKIIDFGLAKLLEPESAMSSMSEDNSEVQTEVKAGTEAGQLLGTVTHMSPEQARGLKIDHRSDIFSFGILLHEILAGERPFKASTAADTISAILNLPAPRLGSGVGGRAQKQLQQMLDRLLAKAPDDRYQSMRDVAEAVAESRRTLTDGSPAMLRRPVVVVAAAVLILAVGGAALWSMYRGGRARWAREEAIPQIVALVERDDYVAAYALAVEAQRLIPNDPLLASLWEDIVVTGSIETTPDGARIYSKPYDDVDGEWELLGESPLDVRIPRGIFRWRIEKEGFVTREIARRSPRGVMQVTLTTKEDLPAGMQLVPAGSLRVPLNGFAPTDNVELGSFWIDEHEVTNRSYKEFVDAGGYEKPEYWKHDFVKDGRALSWEQAMAELRDTTGRAGPATWELGDYSGGQEDYPVSGVSWYEAGAYAAFRGASLPTLYHWSKAALSEREAVQPISPSIVPLSNFGGESPAQVGHHPGLGPYGTYDMAGNVREWCANAWSDTDGHHWVLGGAWNDADYMFTVPYHLPPWDRSAQNGFRLVRYVDDVTDELAAPVAILRRDYNAVEPVSDELFEAFTRLYTYSHSELNASVDSRDESAPNWIRELIHVDTAEGDGRVPMLLFLPKGIDPPYQVVVRFPGLGAFSNRRSHDNLQLGGFDFLVRSGRAVVLPIYQGSFGRWDGFLSLSGEVYLRAFREHMIQWREDVGRALDYLETRPEIDGERVAFLGTSFGSSTAIPLLVLEKRLKTAVLFSGGLPYRALPVDGDAIDYIPRVTLPVLMLNGAYDYIFPLETKQKPMFELLGTPAEHKRHVVYEAGHSPLPRSQVIQETLAWLDRYVGPVE